MYPREIIENLRQELTRYNQEYHTDDSPTVPDSVYDSKYRELISLELQYPEYFDANSPTQRVGGNALAMFEKARHTTPMLSLGNVFDVKEFIAFDALIPGDAVEYYADPKYDGLAINLRYEYGIFTQATTRGDGETGEIVTANVATIKNIPKCLPPGAWPSVLEVRGEVVMPKAGFDEYNEAQLAAGKKTLANTRNGAAGALRTIDPAIAASRPLSFYAYGIGDLWDPLASKHSETMSLLQQWGFEVSCENELVVGIDACLDYYAKILDKRALLPFSIDGVVFKVNDYNVQTELGFRTREPRWATAYKFPPEEVVTQLFDVTFQVGRYGTITPVGHVIPVDVCGVRVSNATLHNFEDIARKDIRYHDFVVVVRAGDVVPKIAGVIKDRRPKGASEILPPTHCPSCKSKLKRAVLVHQTKTKTKETMGTHYLCLNGWNCPEQRLQRLRHFVCRDAFDIEGLAEGTLDSLVNAGYVKYPHDIFKLTREKLLKLEGFAEVSADKLLAAINEKRTVEFWRFLYSLGIPNIGRTASKLLAKTIVSSTNTQLEALLLADDETLLAIPDVGKKTVESIKGFFCDSENTRLVAELLVQVDIPTPIVTATTEELTGEVWVVTGTLTGLTRDEVKVFLESKGAKVTSGVTAKTSFVVAAPGGSTSKIVKARELNVPVLTEADFLSRFGK